MKINEITYDDRIQRLAKAKDNEIDTTLDLDTYTSNDVEPTPRDLDLDYEFDFTEPAPTADGPESGLDKWKRWSKMLRGKETFYTADDGTEVSIDPFGDTRTIKFIKPI